MGRAGRLITTALLIASLAAPAGAAPTGSAFTYQGRLLENANPPTGSYDLEFTLYDVPAGGSPLLPPLVADDVAVASGLFTVSLDFGAGAFPRQGWLAFRPAMPRRTDPPGGSSDGGGGPA